ncbi:uncharacterized protein [Anabrus simplex]|uniref:uncharacterized protein n=1 Tax=Anabrus simplex TaxID=316456 RepID=UPI0034DD9D6A
MRWETLAVCAVCVLGLVAAIPVPQSDYEISQSQSGQVPLDVQERLHTLQLDESAIEQVARDKRTIAVLRQLFPGISQLIDRKIANITQYLFRVIGRAVLRGGLGGGGATGGGGTSNRRVSITLPTFPPDTDEDDTEENEQATTTTEEGATEANTQTELNPEDENQVIGAESQQNEVRLLPENVDQDQELAASGGNDAPDPANVEAASDDSASEDSDRNKRLINFSLGGGASSSGGSGGGSGNFLFDIIRRTADRAARAAGTVYRVVAGTESLGLGLGVSAAAKTTTTARTNMTTATNSTQMTNNNGTKPGLVAGSGNTESSGDAGAGAERDDGYQAGIPGPITRLFVIANRGIANLIQDLILRIAQTSERIVNYKARLITAII